MNLIEKKTNFAYHNKEAKNTKQEKGNKKTKSAENVSKSPKGLFRKIHESSL